MIFIKNVSLLTILICLMPLWSLAATDNIYTLSEITPAPAWDGTNGNRLQSTSTYGDENVVTYTLPWTFTFYGQPYNAITADTNGNIWFKPSTTTSAHSVKLDAVTSRGAFISAWNDDHSSAYLGGVFIQHKTDAPLGDRLVIEWLAETQIEEGLFVPNSFEAVLFPDGRIRIDYGTFNTALGNDTGSGISRGDGVYNDITSNFNKPIYQLAGHSFLYTPIHKNLTVNFTGTGDGLVTVNPAGIAINTNYTVQLFAGTLLTLHPAVDPVSTFTGWTPVATCTSLVGNDCSFTLSNDTTITAGFNRDTAHQVYLPGAGTEYYTTIQAAYNAATTGFTIKTWATDYTEVVNFNKLVDVTLQGGFNTGYSNQVGTTVIQGTFKISQGKVIVNGIAVR